MASSLPFQSTKTVNINKSTIMNQKYLLKEVGNTTFSVLFWNIYKSKLLTTSGSYPIDVANEKLIFEIKYLTSISNEDLVELTKEQWQHIGVKEEQYQPFLQELQNIWPNIIEGDTLSLLVNKDNSDFYFNQKYIGSIEAVGFGQLFIDIWLDDNTSQPELRAELLGIDHNE
jgi:hypothetical protein